jgi:hypothetical protein
MIERRLPSRILGPGPLPTYGWTRKDSIALAFTIAFFAFAFWLQSAIYP